MVIKTVVTWSIVNDSENPILCFTVPASIRKMGKPNLGSTALSEPCRHSNPNLAVTDKPNKTTVYDYPFGLSTNYANGLGIGKVEFRGIELAFVRRESGKPFRRTTPSSPDRNSNLDLPVLGSLSQHDTSALASYATEADRADVTYTRILRRRIYSIIKNFLRLDGETIHTILTVERLAAVVSPSLPPLSVTDTTIDVHTNLTQNRTFNATYSSPMTSLVLTDRSQLTSDSQHLAAATPAAMCGSIAKGEGTIEMRLFGGKAKHRWRLVSGYKLMDARTILPSR
uniref:Uncharacterized protein n=1 Tax=Timema shepardi TaxID=629360 RepID=A0A7R9G459_TIMSH|nr:unnamed protein product [Timema shepardi]